MIGLSSGIIYSSGFNHFSWRPKYNLDRNPMLRNADLEWRQYFYIIQLSTNGNRDMPVQTAFWPWTDHGLKYGVMLTRRPVDRSDSGFYLSHIFEDIWNSSRSDVYYNVIFSTLVINFSLMTSFSKMLTGWSETISATQINNGWQGGKLFSKQEQCSPNFSVFPCFNDSIYCSCSIFHYCATGNCASFNLGSLYSITLSFSLINLHWFLNFCRIIRSFVYLRGFEPH